MKYLQYTDVVLSLRVLYNNLPSFLKKQGTTMFFIFVTQLKMIINMIGKTC